MRIQVARTHVPFVSFTAFWPNFSLFYVPFSPAPFILPRTRDFCGPRFYLRLLLLLLFFFFYYCRHCRLVLFSFCLFSRLRTDSLHSRAPRVEGPRQGKPVSRVRVISPCRHARSSMTFRARTWRECNTNDAPARSPDRRFSSSSFRTVLRLINPRVSIGFAMSIKNISLYLLSNQDLKFWRS